MRTNRRQTNRRGFTLLEVAIATLIVAIGITALLVASASCTTTNAAGEELTDATFLAQEIREYCAGLDPCDLNLAGSYSPPVDASLSTISGMSNWKQVITLQWKDPNGLTDSAVPTDVRYVRVTVQHYDANVLSTSWLVTKAP
jgi:prepilin-type N-terminal cleavage/methylation domain-containing protein